MSRGINRSRNDFTGLGFPAISWFSLACIWVFLTMAPVTVMAASSCGGDGERGCCVVETTDGACDSNLTEIPGCTGDCTCGGINPGNELESSSSCTATTACGGAGQRACCVAESSSGACSGDLVELAGCTGNCYCSAGIFGSQSNGMCIDTACGGDGERACTFLDRPLKPCDDGLFEDLTDEGSCEALLGAANCESPLGGLPSLGTCTSARETGEICSIVGAPPCEDGLVCSVSGLEPLQARCFADISGSLTREQCNDLRADGLLESAVALDTTLSFGIGSTLSAGITFTEEFGVAYGKDGCFSCYQSHCDGYELDVASTIYALVGRFEVPVVCPPDDAECLSFPGPACGYSVSVDVAGDSGYTATRYYAGCAGNVCSADPENDCTFIGATDALTFGVGANPSPFEPGLTVCDTVQTVAGCLNGGEYEEIVNEPPLCENGDSVIQECGGSSTLIPLDGSDSSDPDSDPLTFAWTNNCPGGEFFDAAVVSTDLYVNSSCGNLPINCGVGLSVSDGTDTTACANLPVTVVDTTPPSITCPADIFQQTSAGQCSANVSYNVVAGDSCDGTPVVSCVDQDGFSIATNGDEFGVGTSAVYCTATDCSGNSSQCSFDVTLNDAPQIISVIPDTQVVQYSDQITPVVVTATDCGVADLSLEFEMADVPAWLSLPTTADSCARNAADLMECSFSLTNNDRVLGPVATYVMDNISATDPVLFNGVTLKSDPAESISVEVKHEDALIVLDPANEVAIQVASEGGDSGTFSLFLDVRERGPADTPVDTVIEAPGQMARPGNIANAQVGMKLSPIGPGAPVNGVCSAAGVSPNISSLSYDNVLRVECEFSSIPVNTYSIEANVAGDYYIGGPTEDVFTVFDPSLGFVTGGGWFYWPGTSQRTNYGFNMKYNRKKTNIQGSLLMIRHMSDGTKYRVKSNAVEGLAVGNGDNGNPFGWASFNGKATYKDPSMTDAMGNHAYVVYIEDYAEPGKGVDRFWIQMFDKNRDLISASSLDTEATDNAVIIEGGNIVVPHKTGKKSDR